MRAAAALVALGLLTGCARDAQPPAPEDPAPNVRLLDLADLPAGFSLEREEPLAPHDVSPPFRPPACVQEPATVKLPKTLRVFLRDTARVVEDVTVHETVDSARAALAGVGPQPGCPSTTARAPGQPDVVRAAPSLLPDPRVGDESKAFETPETRTVAFRRGRVVVFVTVVRPDGDMDVLALARRALGLLEG